MLKRESLVGTIFVVIAAFFAFHALQLQVGTVGRMGPGYFPLVIAAVVGGIGAVILAMSLLDASATTVVKKINWSGLLIITASVLAFAALVIPAGLFVATIMLVFISDLASPGRNWLRTLILALVLSTAAALIFVKGIGMQMPLLPSLG
ncbi:tripartite tricarboxylate transporter TctB family protein [Aquamicrobium sp. LC103]|uniref:tripartite tricarboxylate transporter TctB family protein n=1 Tax=Aquamicrobium sp. LC103 TaxID=1120658 RepID=UPI00063E8F73|nr:tripartite tricarboxylate transporter TctB family protein [Aquamicrobium sp. LC103]